MQIDTRSWLNSGRIRFALFEASRIYQEPTWRQVRDILAAWIRRDHCVTLATYTTMEAGKIHELTNSRDYEAELDEIKLEQEIWEITHMKGSGNGTESAT